MATPKKKKPTPDKAPGSSSESKPLFAAGSDALAVAPPAVLGVAAALAGFVPEPTPYDPGEAEKLLVLHRPRLAAIPPDRVEPPRLDVEAACRALLTVHALTQNPQLLPYYKGAAASGEIEAGLLEQLRDFALLLLHAYRQADAAGAFSTNAKLPAELDKESAEVEARVQKVCEHFFLEDVQVGPLLLRLRPGTGYLDRAYDLLGYAQVYKLKQDIVSKDPVHYRVTDEADAVRLAGKILATLGAAMSPKAREAYDVLQRAWTLVKGLYFEVQELGLRFLRYDPQREARFPSLYVVGRVGQGRRKAKKDESAAPAGDESASPADQ